MNLLAALFFTLLAMFILCLMAVSIVIWAAKGSPDVNGDVERDAGWNPHEE